MLLKDKVCLITGAGRGIGKAILTRFIEEGAHTIYANTLTNGSLDSFCKNYNNIFPIYFNVSNSYETKNAVLRIRRETGRLDVLVNNAGIVKDELIGMINRDTIEEVFSVNVYGTIELLQAAARLMIKTGGSIINISSIVGVSGGNTGQLVYSGSKGAITALTKTAARELKSKNIRVNAIAPGIIKTDMTASLIDNEKYRLLNNISNTDRIGSPNDVANVCVFLACDLSNYISGQIINVDGATF